MGLKSGDKAKYYRERRKKHARRARIRAHRNELAAKVAVDSEPVARVVAPEAVEPQPS